MRALRSSRQKRQKLPHNVSQNQKGLDVCCCLCGGIQTLASVLSWARPGPIPGPRGFRPDSPCALFYRISDPSRSRGEGHPGPSWSHPAPERSFQDQAWTGRNRLLGHFRQKLKRIKRFSEPREVTMLGANLSDQIPGGPNLTLTLTLTLNSN